ncbi:MAG: T9SS type A sorting domain-containing protein, partial [Salibacter sp.]|uniref:T9SS type A sorting domain-containing protein n=1 Tax=Salibacter sp. TaxID=2010995 RepID=UPI00287077EE
NSSLLQDIKVFPNPAKSTLNVTCEKCTDMTVSIYSGTGKLIRQTKASQQQKRLDISQLKAGFYLVLTETDQGTITKSIVKN